MTIYLTKHNWRKKIVQALLRGCYHFFVKNRPRSNCCMQHTLEMLNPSSMEAFKLPFHARGCVPDLPKWELAKIVDKRPSICNICSKRRWIQRCSPWCAAALVTYACKSLHLYTLLLNDTKGLVGFQHAFPILDLYWWWHRKTWVYYPC